MSNMRASSTSRYPSDMDADGYLDVLDARIFNDYFYIFDRDGALTNKINLDVLLNPSVADFLDINSVATGDIAGDAKKEIAVLYQMWNNIEQTRHFYIAVLKLDGEVLNGWPIEITDAGNAGGQNGHDVVIADINGDGSNEIISANGAKLHVLTSGGSELSGFPYKIPDSFRGYIRRISVGDITGDSVPEIVFSYKADRLRREDPVSLFVLSSGGTLLSGWPQRSVSTNFWIVPAIADVDGDGINEIVEGVGWGYLYEKGAVYVREADGSISAVKLLDRNLMSSPTVADINGDGITDVVIGSGWMDPESSVYAWSYGDFKKSQNSWPMVGFDTYNSANSRSETELPPLPVPEPVPDPEPIPEPIPEPDPEPEPDPTPPTPGLPKSKLENLGSVAVGGVLTLSVEKKDSKTKAWIEQKQMNYSDYREIAPGDVIPLDILWNEIGGYTATSSGLYRVYAAFDYDSKLISAQYEFRIVAQEIEEPVEEPPVEGPSDSVSCQSGLDCPIYHTCVEGVCVGFCEDSTQTASGSGKAGASAAVQQLEALGYDVIGEADISDVTFQKFGKQVLITSGNQIQFFDKIPDSFVFQDADGNQLKD